MAASIDNRNSKAERVVAANDHIERLCVLPLVDLAATILPAIAQLRVTADVKYEITEWLTDGGPARPSTSAWNAVGAVVAEAIALLEHSGLLIRTILSGGSSGGSYLRLSRLGLAALAKGNLREYLTAVTAAIPAEWLQRGHADLPPSVVTLAQARDFPSATLRYQELTGVKLREAEAVVRAISPFA